jgi:hypothetical protein
MMRGQDISTANERANAIIKRVRSIKSHQAGVRPSFAISQGHIRRSETGGIEGAAELRGKSRAARHISRLPALRTQNNWA